MHSHVQFLHSLLVLALVPLVLIDATSMPHAIRRTHPLTKANSAANRAVGEAEKAYQAASKAAEEAEKAYKSAVNAAKAARRARRATSQVEQTHNWDNVESPKDLFHGVSAKQRENMAEAHSPDQLVVFVQKLARKRYRRKDMVDTEKEAWKSASSQIISQLNTRNCNIFYATAMKAWATCCRVMASEEYFGFCTLLSVLDVPEALLISLVTGKSDGNQVVQTQNPEEFRLGNSSERWAGKMKAVYATTDKVRGRLRGFVLNSTYRWYDSFELGYEEYYSDFEDDVLYVDLFAVPCYPPIDLGLCSQFCCAGDNTASYFCNSNLECY